MIKYLYRSVKDERIRKLSNFKPGAWLFVYEPTDEDVQLLEERFNLDEDLIEDAMDLFEVPRLEYEEGVVYLFTRYVLPKSIQSSYTAPIMIAISDKFILTFSHKKPDFLIELQQKPNKAYTTQKMKFLLIILDLIIKNYNQSLIQIKRQLRRIMTNVDNVSDEDLKNIVKIESMLMDYLSALLATATALDEMISKEKLLTLHEEDVDILEDLVTDTQQIIDTTKSAYKTAQNIRSTHEVIIGHKLNATMKMLAAITVLLAIPTVIAGIFGMNVWLPVSADSPFGFGLISAVTALLVAVTTYFFVKNKWM